MPGTKLGFASRTARHVNRYRQILTVLVKYGFGGLVDRLGISHYIELGLQMFSQEHREQVEQYSNAERLRLVLEELGPTFIKLGQVLSTRPDLVPAEYIKELSKLQRDVPSFPVQQAREIIEDDLRQPVSELFERFDEKPIAAASIGQVHRARRRNGAEVIVKVRRPNIETKMEVDLEILLHLATLIENHVEGWHVYRPSRIVDEFRRVVERELDYRIEARHVERFATQFRDDETTYVPGVHRDFTTERVLTLEYVDVTPVTDRDALVAAGLDPEELARRGTELTLKQIFVHGFFHADPHPGNVFALPGNVVCFLDFGMMGRLDRRGRETFADLVYAVGTRDPIGTTAALVRLAAREDEDTEFDTRALERDVAEFIDLNIPTALSELDFGHWVHELTDLLARHGMYVPANFAMMLKAAATAEQLVTRLDPDMNVIAAAKPYVRRLKYGRLKPTRLMRESLEAGRELLTLAQEIPSGVRDLLRQSKRGTLRIGFEHRGLEGLQGTLERVANRVAFAIVVAALVVGSSLIVHSELPPTWHGVPVVGVVGFVLAGLMGFWLLVSILRHHRL